MIYHDYMYIYILMSWNKICCSYIDYETIYIIKYVSYIYIYIIDCCHLVDTWIDDCYAIFSRSVFYI